MLLYLKKYNIKYKEIEIETIYIDNNNGSHFNTIKDSYKIYKEIFKFSMSSFISFIIDYLLYSLFIILFNNIIISNIFARVISSITNYNINKKIVFKSNNKSIISYFSLVVFILILNTFLLSILTNYINAFIAKIIVELLLFVISYICQKEIVFKEVDFHKKVL